MMDSKSLQEFSLLIGDWWAKLNDKQSSLEALTPEKIKEMYAIGYRLYRDKRYREAIHFFQLLTVANPLEKKYWKGLGASLQMLNQYEQALRCYYCIQVTNPDLNDPYLLVHMADCYFGLKEVEKGLTLLEEARINAKKQNNTQVLNHVALMQELWSNHLRNR